MKLIKIKVKEVLGKDVDCAIGDFNTDAVVNLNFNDLAKSEGIVSFSFFLYHAQTNKLTAERSF